MYYFDVIDGLQRAQIRYLIAGGLAVNLHGIPRVTQDLDLILAMDSGNIHKFCNLMKDLGYSTRILVNPEQLADPEKVKEWVDQKNLKAFSFVHHAKSTSVVDVLLVHPLDFNDAERRKTVRRVGNTDLYSVSIDDLITMKKYSGRKQDESDVAMLEKAKKLNGGSP